MTKEEELNLKNYLLEGIAGQVSHDYDTEEEFEEKYGPTDTIDDVIDILVDIKDHDDLAYVYCPACIDADPDNYRHYLRAFDCDIDEIGDGNYAYKIAERGFLSSIDDREEILINTESKDPEGHFVEVYVNDTGYIRSLLTTDGNDPLKNSDDEVTYGEDYQINFYAEYYPHTDDVALHVSPCYDSNKTAEIVEGMLYSDTSRIKDGYVLLNNAEKELLRAEGRMKDGYGLLNNAEKEALRAESRIKDSYVLLNDTEKEALRAAVKDMAIEEIEELLNDGEIGKE